MVEGGEILERGDRGDAPAHRLRRRADKQQSEKCGD
jgi:hypothetical protein